MKTLRLLPNFNFFISKTITKCIARGVLFCKIKYWYNIILGSITCLQYLIFVYLENFVNNTKVTILLNYNIKPFKKKMLQKNRLPQL